MKTAAWLLGCVLGLVVRLGAQVPTTSAGEPFAIATFHCLGLYWSPPDGAADKAVRVQFRRAGETAWQEGLALRYNPIAETDEDLTDYRGSLVNLAPNTTYEVQLTLAGTSNSKRLTGTTWSEQFPVGETVQVRNSYQPLTISESGTPWAYRVYDGRGITIDVRHQHDACIVVNASYVILRGFTLRGAGAPVTGNAKAIGALNIKGGGAIS